MVEKRMRGTMCQVVYLCTKTNDKYMKDDDQRKKSSYLKY